MSGASKLAWYRIKVHPMIISITSTTATGNYLLFTTSAVTTATTTTTTTTSTTRNRGYFFFSVKDQNLFHRVDTIGNIFTR